MSLTLMLHLIAVLAVGNCESDMQCEEAERLAYGIAGIVLSEDGRFSR